MRQFACLAAVGVFMPATATPQAPVFPTYTEMVRLDVLVSGGGRPLQGLTVDDFQVFDNGHPQTLQRADAYSGPLDVWLVFDKSESVAGHLQDLIRAAEALNAELDSRDRSALLTASDRLRLIVPLTHDHGLVRQELGGLIAEGNTRVLDGLYAALLLTEEPTRRSMIVACTDGYDNVSWSSEADTLEAAGAANATVYTVGLRSRVVADQTLRPSWLSLAREVNEGFLRRLAADTGGRFLPIGSPKRLQTGFASALAEMKTGYVLGYSPQGGAAQAGWHTVEVRLARRKGDVRTRRRYLVPMGRVAAPSSSEPSNQDTPWAPRP